MSKIKFLTFVLAVILFKMIYLLLQIMALLVATTWLIIYLGLLRSIQAGAYYGMKQMPPQVPQYPPLGQQVPHMPLGKDGVPMQHMGKEGSHLSYGKEYIPQYIKEIPQIPMLGKERISKKQKGNMGKIGGRLGFMTGPRSPDELP